ncbi:ribonuclease III [Candidatus Beckwithbacteria bacterium]|nr:ribonuclease III [Candidatus Beckwithbacteria bacterium]
MTSLTDCQQKLNYQYQNQELLERALTHRSYLNENRSISESNERLEFLGDAVLELVTSDFLFKTETKLPEGKLTSLRAKIVQTKTLAAVATRLDLGSYIKLSKGEEASGGNHNASILADLVEAIIGSIYLDGGLAAVTTFIDEQLLQDYKQLVQNAQVEDWKSKLQEQVQAKGGIAPTYEVIKEEGPDHDRQFTVQVYFFDAVQAEGTGRSKQAAQQAAAQQALEKIVSLG